MTHFFGGGADEGEAADKTVEHSVGGLWAGNTWSIGLDVSCQTYPMTQRLGTLLQRRRQLFGKQIKIRPSERWPKRPTFEKKQNTFLSFNNFIIFFEGKNKGKGQSVGGPVGCGATHGTCRWRHEAAGVGQTFCRPLGAIQ